MTTTRPTDITDLYLAPVALRIDRQLAELDHLTEEGIHVWIALTTDHEATTLDERRILALRALAHEVDTHHWDLQHDPRGVRLSHGDNSLVLGIPESLRSYLSGSGM
ncbi:hypothetical protein [Nocardioides sp. SR21]|uniref:hypothetical protein n=1 Tax=Nocardioides sp. SR21 TaxID=2919501 RepID=UPI001FAB1773|nr:hypothetical protein [Nocardioides sp. SR21]